MALDVGRWNRKSVVAILTMVGGAVLSGVIIIRARVYITRHVFV